MFTSLPKKSFVGAALGTVVECYDYALFSILLPILAPLFFPAETLYGALAKGYLVLSITLIARPFGGLFFGYLGDKFGRRQGLLASIYGIALTTMVIGMTPTYEAIGIWATVLIIITKSIQIFCFGGEYNGAGIYVVEHAQNNNEWSTLFSSISLWLIFIGLGSWFTLNFVEKKERLAVNEPLIE